MGTEFSAGYVDSVDMSKFREKFPVLAEKMDSFKDQFSNCDVDLSGEDLARITEEITSAGVVKRYIESKGASLECDLKKPIGDVFDSCINTDSEDSDAEKIMALSRSYIDLATEFFKATDGLILTVFYNGELMNGSEPEEFEYMIDGLYELTPQGKNLKDMLVRMFYSC